MKHLASFVAKLRSSSFVRDAAILAMGTATSQAILVFALPILSRAYTPAEFGNLAVFSAVSGVVAILLTLRYETAILLPKSDDEAMQLVALCSALSILIAIPLAVLAASLPNAWRAAIGLGNLGGWLPVAVAVGLGTATVATGSAWLSRLGKYRTIAKLRVAQSAIISAAGIGLGLWGLDSGLLVAQSLGWIASALLVGFALSPLSRFAIRRDLVTSFRSHSNALKFLLPTALLDIATLQLPILIIAAIYSHSEAGQFSLAWRLLTLPAGLIGGAIGLVFFQRASKTLQSGTSSLRSKYIQISVALFAASVVPLFVILLFGAPLFELVFGQEWRAAGEIAEVLVISCACYFVFSPTSSVLIILNRQKLIFAFSLFQLLYRVGAGFLSTSTLEYVRILVVFEVINVIVFELLVLSLLRSNATIVPR